MIDDCARCRVMEVEVNHLRAEVARLEEQVKIQKAWAKSFYNGMKEAQAKLKEVEGDG